MTTSTSALPGSSSNLQQSNCCHATLPPSAQTLGKFEPDYYKKSSIMQEEKAGQKRSATNPSFTIHTHGPSLKTTHKRSPYLLKLSRTFHPLFLYQYHRYVNSHPLL
jgi:hypothetical protein